MSDELASVVIDVPRGGFIKRNDDGAIDFVSPIPSPFNYGHMPGTLADDGDAVDAVVLGPRLPRGTCTRVVVRGTIGFVDAGVADPKQICSDRPIDPGERRRVEGFFRRYAAVKRLINRVRGEQGTTRYLGWL